MHAVDGESGREDSEMSLLFEQSQSVRLNVRVRNEEFFSACPRGDAGPEVVLVVYHRVKESHHFGLHELVDGDPLA